MDTDRSGTIGTRELAALGQTLSRNWTPANNDKLLRMIQRGGPNGQVSPADFEDFIIGSLQKCYRKLDVNGDGQLESRELEPISQAFNQNHQDTLRQMAQMGGNGNGVAGPDQFVQFVVEHCLRGLQGRQAVQGLGEVLVMGGDGL